MSERRRRKGLSQDALAKEVEKRIGRKVTQATISRYENGVVINPKDKELAPAIAEILGLRPENLRYKPPQPKKSAKEREREILLEKEKEREELISEFENKIRYFTEVKEGVREFDLKKMPEGLMSRTVDQIRDALLRCKSLNEELYRLIFPNDNVIFPNEEQSYERRDFDVIAAGKSESQKHKNKIKVYHIIEKLHSKSSSAKDEKIIQQAEKLGIHRPETEAAIARLVQEAAIFEPVRYSGYYKLTGEPPS
jgi:transcriptional regulator with XRE-family HTH domain